MKPNYLAVLATSMVAAQYAPFGYDSPQMGSIGLANSSNLVTLDTALTEFATGAPQDPTLQALRDAIAPMVPAGETFQYLVHNEADGWTKYANNDHKRAVGGDFPVIKPTGTKATGSCDDRGLTVAIDHRQGGQLPAVRQRWIQNIKNTLLRCDVAEIFALMDTNKTDAASVNWGVSNATADPDADAEALLESSGDVRGANANVIVFTGNAFYLRSRAFRRALLNGSMQEYSKTAEGLRADLSPFGVESVLIGNQRYQNGAVSKGKIVSTGSMWAIFVQQGATNQDPSNFKRFVDMSQGADFSVFIEEKATHTLLTVYHRAAIVCTSSLGIYRQPVTNT